MSNTQRRLGHGQFAASFLFVFFLQSLSCNAMLYALVSTATLCAPVSKPKPSEPHPVSRQSHPLSMKRTQKHGYPMITAIVSATVVFQILTDLSTSNLTAPFSDSFTFLICWKTEIKFKRLFHLPKDILIYSWFIYSVSSSPIADEDMTFLSSPIEDTSSYILSSPIDDDFLTTKSPA